MVEGSIELWPCAAGDRFHGVEGLALRHLCLAARAEPVGDPSEAWPCLFAAIISGLPEIKPYVFVSGKQYSYWERAMSRSRFSTTDILRALIEHEAGVSVKEVSLKRGISPRTFYRWKAKWGSEKSTEASSHAVLAEEIRQLKKLLAESMLSAEKITNSSDRK